MATAKYELPEEFLQTISKLEQQTDIIVPRVLEAGGMVVLKIVREHLRAVIGRVKKLPSKSTGELVDALGLSPARLDRKGDYNVKVGFSEPRSDGDSNAKVANILEYGRHGQKEQVIRLHEKLLASTGGLHGIRDEGMLESALESPFHTFEGEDFYPTVVAKIVQTAYSLVRNHAFVDGNKRIGVYVLLILLELNHIAADFTDDDVIRIGMELASGTMSREQLLELVLGRIV